jgi:hypothetical protein
VLAIDPTEVPRISEAEALGFPLTAVARSGHPDDPGDKSVTPSVDPFSDRKTIVTMVGGKRQLVVFQNGKKTVIDESPPDDDAAAAKGKVADKSRKQSKPSDK